MSSSGHIYPATNNAVVGHTLSFRNVYSSGTIYAANGAITTPSYTFGSDTTQGFYTASSGAIYLRLMAL